MCRLNIFSDTTLFASLDPLSAPVCFFAEADGFGTGRGLLDGIDFDDMEKKEADDKSDSSSGNGKNRLRDKIF